MSFKNGTMKFVPEYKLINKSNNDTVIECDYIEAYEPRSTTNSSIRILAQYTSRAMLKLAAFASDAKEKGEAQEQSVEEEVEGKRMEEISAKSFLERTDKEHEESSDFLAKQLHMSCEALCDIGFTGLFVDAFKKVLLERSGTKPVAVLFANEQTPVNQGIFNALHTKDQDRFATGYCAFFGIGLLGSQKTSSKSVSEQPTEVKAL